MSDAGPGGERRVFLGWDGPLLPRAADWLLERFGADLADVVVSLPGRRAARRLEALLVERAAARGLRELAPPRLITAGHLGDELLLPLRPVAGRVLRTLRWCDALAALPQERLVALFRDPPAAGERAQWLAFAEELRGLHGTLAAEGCDFRRAAAALAELLGVARGQPAAQAEIERWSVLAQVQQDYRARLAEAGRADPHEGRWESLRARAFTPAFAVQVAPRPAGAPGTAAAGQVVLVGVVEFNALTRQLLETLGTRATALVGAPLSERDAFDAWGAARPAAWCTRALPLERATWSTADTPDGQAARAMKFVVEWIARDGPTADVVLGVPDESVTPFLERRLAEHGVTARPATAGTFRDSPAGTLLSGLHELLAGGDFSALAALARQPAVFAALVRAAGLGGRDPLALLDAAQAAHLPGRVCGPGAPRTDWRTLSPVLAALQALLGELLSGRARAWEAWAAPISEALSAVFGDATVVAEARETHALHASLGVLAPALDELASLPAGGAMVEARDALALLLGSCGGAEVPPRADSDAVDLLGWLEVPLDEACDLVLTGFNAGALPSPPASARWLPEALRVALGVPGERERLARDACLLTHVLHSRSRVALVSGRIGSARDPLLPSPLAFHVPDEDVPARVRTWLSETASAPRTSAASMTESGLFARALPRLPVPPQRVVSVTSLRTYLSAPYRYYLEHVLRLQRAQDDAHELDGRGFGTLAHAVLEAFGKGACCDSGDDAAVSAALQAALDAESRARFGPRPLPAVAVQVEQLRYRLQRFATWQAGSARDGWRIAAVEWAPTAPVFLEVNGTPVELRGKIDRIDVHADGVRWRVLDYKTGDEVREPEATHRTGDGAWRDLQLPLYARLVGEFAAGKSLACQPELGYLALSRDAEGSGLLRAEWSEACLEEALEAARAVLSRIVAGEFFESPDGSLGDPIFDAIGGQGLLESAEDAARASAADGGDAPTALAGEDDA